MASYIKQFFDFLGNEVFPKTREKAVYDENGVRLDNKLNNISDKINTKPLTTGQDLNNLVLQLNHSTGSTTLVNSLINKPSSVVNGEVYLSVKVIIPNYIIQTLYHTLGANVYVYERNLSNTTWSSWKRIINTNDLVQSDTVSDANKPASSVVTKALNDKKLNYIVVNNGTDLNTIGTGLFVGQGFLNAPTNEWYTILATNIGHAGSQLAMNINNGHIYSRSMGGGNWEGWLVQSNTKLPFNLTPASGLKITASTCYRIYDRAYIEATFELTNGANFQNGVVELCTFPYYVRNSLVAISTVGLDSGGNPKAVTSGMLTSWDSKIRVTTTTSDTKTININSSFAINA